MRFNRMSLNDSAISLLQSSNAVHRCIGRNFLIEENVADQRLVELERFLPHSQNVLIVSVEYFMKNVQGEMRGHFPSTFDEKINGPFAILV